MKVNEDKWTKRWLKGKIYSPDLHTAKRPFYNLMMFPYPSAEGLHVGNMYAFTGADIYGRAKRMQGYNVFEPIGLDGFGIHSENYAIKIRKHPKDHAKDSEKNFYRQLSEIGNGFAWDARLETYDPEYYKWTQWLFIQMFKSGLAYKDKAMVNWCPSCKTVLADEQVLVQKPSIQSAAGGPRKSKDNQIAVCERCGTKVQKREMSSWFFRITKYADKLLAGIEKIDWPEKIKTAQKQWIGKKEGIRVKFPLNDVPGQTDFKHSVDVFTTRLDTIFGATFIVVSPDLADRWLVLGWKAPTVVRKYIKEALNNAKENNDNQGGEKTGADSGLKAINPVSGEKIPVWISDYVVGEVGTGAIMGVPAHDERDNEFAKKFGLPIKLVIEPETGKVMPNEERRRSIVAIVEDPKTKKYLTLDWGSKLGGTLFIGGGMEEKEDEVKTAIREVKEETGYANLKFVSKTEPTHHHYFAFSKKVARNVESVGLYFQLNGSEREESSLQYDEKGNFKIQWLTKDEILARMEDENHLLCFRRLVLGEVYTGKGILGNSGKFNGVDSEGARKEILKDLVSQKLASKETIYHLRDWLISRQRYWGPPIPMIYCEECAALRKSSTFSGPASAPKKSASLGASPLIGANYGWFPVPEEDLPVILPDIKDFKPKGDGVSPLYNAPDSWKKVKCPNCGKVARRELDVSDTFLDSAWYFLRYPSVDAAYAPSGSSSTFGAPSPKSASATRMRLSAPNLPWDIDITRRWLPVNAYIGGAEHAVLHLLYARFAWMMLVDNGFLSKDLGDEPFPFLYGHGLIIKDGAKMSKSKGNIVVPDEYVDKYGADTLRTYLMFLGPYDQGGDFRDTGIEGMNRFLNRVWKLYKDHLSVVLESEADSREVLTKMHQTIKKVTEDIETFRYNTAIASMMEFVNLLYEKVARPASSGSSSTSKTRCAEWDESLESLCLLLAPFAPFMTEEIWCEILGKPFSIHTSPWPKYKDEFLKVDNVQIAVQVNGKLRSQMTVNSKQSKSRSEIEAMARKDEKVAKWLGGTIKKVIFVPEKIINFVVE